MSLQIWLSLFHHDYFAWCRGDIIFLLRPLFPVAFHPLWYVGFSGGVYYLSYQWRSAWSSEIMFLISPMISYQVWSLRHSALHLVVNTHDIPLLVCSMCSAGLLHVLCCVLWRREDSMLFSSLNESSNTIPWIRTMSAPTRTRNHPIITIRRASYYNRLKM